MKDVFGRFVVQLSSTF